jgi:hypothetical protein
VAEDQNLVERLWNAPESFAKLGEAAGALSERASCARERSRPVTWEVVRVARRAHSLLSKQEKEG